MSIRVDTASLIPGAVVVGNRGLGVLGSQVPSTGENGAGYLYNDLTLPADANKEVRGLIETAPVGVTSFFAYEDSSFTLTAPTGNYSFIYRLFEDGVDKSTATASVTIGGATINLVGANASQSASSGTGVVTVVRTINLAGANTSQSAVSGTGAVTVTPPAAGTVNLVGADASQSATSGGGAVTINRNIALVGAATSQSAASSSGTVTVTPSVATINLVGANSTQSAASGTGVVTVVQPAVINLVGAPTTQSASSSTGSIAISAVGLLPANPGRTYAGSSRERTLGSGSGMNWNAKRAVEKEVFTVNFDGMLGEGETIQSATWSNSVLGQASDDPNPSAMIVGSPSISGTMVSTLIGGGIPGNTYAPVCKITTNVGQVLVLPEFGAGLLKVTS